MCGPTALLTDYPVRTNPARGRSLSVTNADWLRQNYHRE
jgi:hypothetical protein